MAIGDDALAAGFTPVAGTAAANTIDTEINRLADWTANRTSTVTPVVKGGTGATNAAGARTNLDVYSKAEVSAALSPYAVWSSVTDNFYNRSETDAKVNSRARIAPGSAHPGLGFYTTNDGKLWFRPDPGTAAFDVRLLGTYDLGSYLPLAGGALSGDLFLPNASAATSGYTVAYINADGRVSRGSSSLRYKDLLEDPDVSNLGSIFPPLREFSMKGDETRKPTLGYIAEELAENEATERFVVRYNGEIESIDFIQLLLAQVAALNKRLADLEVERRAERSETADETLGDTPEKA